MAINDFLKTLSGTHLASPGGDAEFGRAGGSAGVFSPLLCSRLIIACALFFSVMVIGQIPYIWKIVMLVLSALIAGCDVLAAAVVAVMERRYFDRNVLVGLASIIAFIIGRNIDAAAMVLIYSIGDIFTNYAFQRTSETMLDLLAPELEFAHMLTDAGEADLPICDVQPGRTIAVHPGEYVPCDCIVQAGGSTVDISTVGGGTELLEVTEGDELLAGSLNLSGVLQCEVIASYEESTIIALRRRVVDAAGKGSAISSKLNKIAQYFAPSMLVAAVAALLVSMLVMKAGLAEAVARGLMIAALASPSVMLASMPLIRLAGIARMAKAGILISGNDALSAAARVDTLITEKSGTLTDGTMHVSSVKSDRMEPELLLKITAHAYAYSGSPIAKHLIASYGGTIYIELVSDFTEDPGRGVEVSVEGVHIDAGTAEYMADKGVLIPAEDLTRELSIYVAFSGIYAGRLIFSDNLRETAGEGMKAVKDCGVNSIVMFTNDIEEVAKRTSEKLGIDEYYCACVRERKLDIIGDIKRAVGDSGSVMFVGNEKALGKPHTAADIDAAVCGLDEISGAENADLMFVNGNLVSFAGAIGTSKYVFRFSKYVFAAAAAVKIIMLALALFGVSTLWFTVLIDSATAMASNLISIKVCGKK